MCNLIEVTFPIHGVNAERLSPYEPTQKEFLLTLSQKKQKDFPLIPSPMQKDIPLIRGQCRITFLYAEPNYQKL
jgi:hypothetical protein